MSLNSPNSIPLSPLPPLTPSPPLEVPSLKNISAEQVSAESPSAQPEPPSVLVETNSSSGVGRIFQEILKRKGGKIYNAKVSPLVEEGLLRRSEMTFLDPCSTEFILEKIGECLPKTDSAKAPPEPNFPPGKRIEIKNLVTKIRHYTAGGILPKEVSALCHYPDTTAPTTEEYTEVWVNAVHTFAPSFFLLGTKSSSSLKTSILREDYSWSTSLEYVEIQSIVSGFKRIQTEEIVDEKSYYKQIGLSIIKGGIGEEVLIKNHTVTLINLFEAKEGRACALTYLVQSLSKSNSFLHTRWVLSYSPIAPYWREVGAVFLSANYLLNPYGLKICPAGEISLLVRDRDSKALVAGIDTFKVVNDALTDLGILASSIVGSRPTSNMFFNRIARGYAVVFLPSWCVIKDRNPGVIPNLRFDLESRIGPLVDSHLVLLDLIKMREEFLQKGSLSKDTIHGLDKDILQFDSEKLTNQISQDWGRTPLRNVFLNAIRASARPNAVVTNSSQERGR